MYIYNYACIYICIHIPLTLPPSHPHLSPLSVLSPQYIGATFQDAFIVAIISFSIGVSLLRMFAKKNHYTISANQVCGRAAWCVCVGWTVVLGRW